MDCVLLQKIPQRGPIKGERSACFKNVRPLNTELHLIQALDRNLVRAQTSQDAAPVGIFTVKGCLEKRTDRQTTRRFAGPVPCRARRRAGLRRASWLLRRRERWLARGYCETSVRALRNKASSSAVARPHAAGAVGEQEDRVVGRCFAIHADHVETQIRHFFEHRICKRSWAAQRPS